VKGLVYGMGLSIGVTEVWMHISDCVMAGVLFEISDC